MRVFIAAAILGLLWAQAEAQPAPPGGADAPITRQQFIARASAQAAQRFDAIDVNHTGVVTRAQVKAWRAAHHGRGGDGFAPAAPQ